VSFGQHFHPNCIDSLTKKSDFIVVIQIEEFWHAYNFSNHLFNETSKIKFRKLYNYNSMQKTPNYVNNNSYYELVFSHFCEPHLCNAYSGNECYYYSLHKGDTCMIFLKKNDSLDTTQRFQLTFDGMSKDSLQLRTPSIYKFSDSLYYYYNTVKWVLNEGKYQKQSRVNKKVRWIEHQIISDYTDLGVIYKSTDTYTKGRKNFTKTKFFDKNSGIQERTIVEWSKRINTFKYPSNRDKRATYFRYKEKEYDKNGVKIKSEKGVSKLVHTGHKF
jgi:hypothetical protein